MPWSLLIYLEVEFTDGGVGECEWRIETIEEVVIEGYILELEIASEQIDREFILLETLDHMSERVQNYFFKNSLDHQIYAIIL